MKIGDIVKVGDEPGFYEIVATSVTHFYLMESDVARKPIKRRIPKQLESALRIVRPGPETEAVAG